MPPAAEMIDQSKKDRSGQRRMRENNLLLLLGIAMKSTVWQPPNSSDEVMIWPPAVENTCR
jgi:hypothetical protein